MASPDRPAPAGPQPTSTFASLKNCLLPVPSYRVTAGEALRSFVHGRGGSSTSSSGVKAVILDPSLYQITRYGGIGGDLFTTCEVTVLSEVCKYNANATSLTYLIRPSIENLKLVTEHISEYLRHAPNAKVRVGVCPHTVMAEHILTNEYGLGDLPNFVGVEQIEVGLIPIEEDVLSLEMSGDYRDLFLSNDVTILHSVAKSIVELQTAHAFGPIKTIKAKGKYATKVLSILGRLEHEVGHDKICELPAKVDAMYIIDRSVDNVTPLMTQLTYEGLIDELYGIDASVCSPPFEAITDEASLPFRHPDGIVPLHSNDTIFQDLRDRNFAAVGGVLRNKSLEVKASYEERKTATALKQIKEFMSRLPETQARHRQIGIHTNIATEIGRTTQNPSFRERIAIEHHIIRQEEERKVSEYIDDLINKGDDVRQVLRLLCLMSVVNGGIKPKVYDAFKETLLLSYGIPEMIAALHSLEAAGLLLKNDGRTGVFAGIRRASRLWVEGLNEQRPDDAAYAYSGYCPLLTRTVEALCADSNINTNLAAAAQGGGLVAAGVGGMFDLGAQIGNAVTQGAGVGGAPAAGSEDYAVLTKDSVQGSGASHVTIVYVIGGITHAELSTLRFLGKRPDRHGQQRNFIFITTSLTNGTRMMSNLLPFLPVAEEGQ